MNQAEGETAAEDLKDETPELTDGASVSDSDDSIDWARKYVLSILLYIKPCVKLMRP